MLENKVKSLESLVVDSVKQVEAGKIALKDLECKVEEEKTSYQNKVDQETKVISDMMEAANGTSSALLVKLEDAEKESRKMGEEKMAL